MFPLRRAVTMQSEQNLWRHSLVVIVFFSMSRQIGHMSSECSDRGETAISVPSIMASCGVRCSSYRLSSHVLLAFWAFAGVVMVTGHRPPPHQGSTAEEEARKASSSRSRFRRRCASLWARAPAPSSLGPQLLLRQQLPPLPPPWPGRWGPTSLPPAPPLHPPPRRRRRHPPFAARVGRDVDAEVLPPTGRVRPT